MHLHKKTESFIDFLEQADKDGKIVCSIKNYDKTKKLGSQDIKNLMTHLGFEMFSLGLYVPDLKQKIKPTVSKKDKEYVFTFNLLPLLGFPNSNPQAEMKELKNFLTLIKNDSVKNISDEIILQFHCGFGKPDLDVFADNLLVEKNLKEQVQEKISQSETLSKWLENQKIGIANHYKTVGPLLLNFHTYHLMSKEHQIDYFEKKEFKNQSVVESSVEPKSVKRKF